MEIHQLRYFVAVARLGNFSRAAEQCHVSQPSLSQQIQKLERSLGHPLLDRLGKRAVVTDAGRVLLERAAAILSAVDNAEREVKDFDRAMGGRLVVGAIPTVAPYLLPEAVKDFTAQHPSVELVIHEDFTSHLIRAAAAGDLDVALMALPVPDERLTCEALFTEALVLALPTGHRLLAKKKITLADVREERFIVLNDIHCLGEQVLYFCREGGCQRITCRSSQLSTVLTLVGLGQGVSLVPEMAQPAPGPAGPVVFRHLADCRLQRTIAAVWHKNRYHGAAGVRFLAALKGRIAGAAR